MIKLPVSSHCRQCLCSFYYLSCSGRGSFVWVNRWSLRSVSHGHTFLLPSSSSCLPELLQEERQTPLANHRKMLFSSTPSVFSHGWHQHSACQPKPFVVQHPGAHGVWRQPVSACQGWIVRGGGMWTPAYLSMVIPAS